METAEQGKHGGIQGQRQHTPLRVELPDNSLLVLSLSSDI